MSDDPRQAKGGLIGAAKKTNESPNGSDPSEALAASNIPADSLPTISFVNQQQDANLPQWPVQTVSSSANDVVPIYRLERLLGEGGFGRVYLAKRITDERVFAVKMLNVEHRMSMQIKQRFLREATVLSQLQHPRIVRFHELGMTDAGFYLVMDYVEAISWEALRKSLPESQHMRVATKVIDHCLDALDFAHQQGIVHRDIKPSNLLLQKTQGQLHVRLADFGLAKNFIHAGHSGMTSDHAIAGTFGFMAPELLEGVRFYKPESDQYAVAATLFHMLTGRTPVGYAKGSNPLIELRRHAIPAIASLAPSISPALGTWIHRGLEADPKKRFLNVAEMRKALRNTHQNSAHPSE